MPRSDLTTRGSTAAWRRRIARWQARIDAGEIIDCARAKQGQCLLKSPRIRPGMKWDLDHYLDDGDDNHTAPSHCKCNRSHGGRKGGITTGAMKQDAAQAQKGAVVFGGPMSGTAMAVSRTHTPEPEGFAADDSIWDSAPWLDELRDVPANATWPRLMTAPHPRAVGTLGPDFEANLVLIDCLRWFQRLAAYRLLEVDVEGRLVWRAWLLTLARQLGKSLLLAELILWRMRNGGRFGGPQSCLHVANQLGTASAVQAPARAYADLHPDEWRKYYSSNTKSDIAWLLDGSKWMCKAYRSPYGLSNSLAIVDEGFDIDAGAVEEGIAPTLLAREQSQLGLVSTAHRKAKTLMRTRRTAAMQHLASGAGDLLLEWSASRDADSADPAAWRLASPHWDADRAAYVASACERAMLGEGDPSVDVDPIEFFRGQYLNIWPLGIHPEPEPKGELLIDINVWAERELTDPAAGPITVVVEDDRRGGAAVAAAFMRGDGRVVVTGSVFDGVAEAAAQARKWLAAIPGSRLLVGASMLSEPELRPMLHGNNAVGAAELRGGLALFRRAMAADRLWHDEDCADLTGQLSEARVAEGVAGLSLLPGSGRTDLVRAAVWAVQAVYDAPPTPRID